MKTKPRRSCERFWIRLEGADACPVESSFYRLVPIITASTQYMWWEDRDLGWVVATTTVARQSRSISSKPHL